MQVSGKKVFHNCRAKQYFNTEGSKRNYLNSLNQMHKTVER